MGKILVFFSFFTSFIIHIQYMLDNIFSKIWKSKNHSVNVTKVINHRGLIWERETRLNEWLKYRFINKRISWEEKNVQYITQYFNQWLYKLSSSYLYEFYCSRLRDSNDITCKLCSPAEKNDKYDCLLRANFMPEVDRDLNESIIFIYRDVSTLKMSWSRFNGNVQCSSTE